MYPPLVVHQAGVADSALQVCTEVCTRVDGHRKYLPKCGLRRSHASFLDRGGKRFESSRAYSCFSGRDSGLRGWLEERREGFCEGFCRLLHR